jgi:hypothetical protein
MTDEQPYEDPMMTTEQEAARIDIEPETRAAAEDAAGGFDSTMLERLAERIGTQAGSSAVFGDPVDKDGRTVIPVSQSMWGTGAGSGSSEESGSGGGGGGGAMSRPVGFIEVDADGSRFRPLSPAWQDAKLVLAYSIGAWLILRTLVRLIRR